MKRKTRKGDHRTPYLWELLPELPGEESLRAEQVAELYVEAYQQLLGKVPRSIKEVRVAFYPYREVQARARQRDGVLQVRIAEVLHDMPERLHRALALILVGKLEHKAYPKSEEERFDRYAKSDRIVRRLARQPVRRRRPRRTKHYGTAGRRFDLNEVFDQVNREYFEGRLPRPPLSWTRNSGRRRMGYVEEGSRKVFISRSMDRPSVPRYAIEFIMYHELLHLIYPSERRGRKMLHHTKAFRQAERRFKHYAKARRWMGYEDES